MRTVGKLFVMGLIGFTWAKMNFTFQIFAEKSDLEDFDLGGSRAETKESNLSSDFE